MPYKRPEDRKRYRLANREKQRLYMREWSLSRKYGITSQDYENLLEKQGGGCALCHRTPDQERYGRLHIDHDHSSGKIRGLLCGWCNHRIVGSGTLEFFRKIVRYLEEANV